MIAAVNAIGNHFPPMLIFQRVHFKEQMLSGAPRSSIGGANPTCWSNERLFVDYLRHFITCEKTLYARPVLLMLDYHESHLSIPAIYVVKENGISCLNCCPIHHVSYSQWNILSLLPLMIGCCQTHANQ
jgi:DDE superfamily endonuclease.